MLRFIILCCLFCTGTLVAQATVPPGPFGRLPTPPLNGRSAPKAKPVDQPVQIVPDPGSFPVALFSVGKATFTGTFKGQTEVTVEDRCILLNNNKRSVADQVCFALPDGMKFRPGKFGEVNTDLQALSGLEGKREHLYLLAKDEKSLALAYHFEVGDTPRELKMEGLPVISQKRAGNTDEKSDYTTVTATIETDNGTEELKPGQLQRVRFRGGNFLVFLHTSLRQNDAGSCGEEGYILRVIYLRDERA